MEAIEALIPDTLINTMAGSIKTLDRRGDIVTVGDYGILWGGPAKTDLVGDWFTDRTYLGAQKGLGVDTMLHHGMPLSDALKDYADILFNPTTEATPDEHGLLVKTVLDLSDRYQRRIYDLVEQKAFSWSGGAPPHSVKRANNAQRGEIKRWFLSEFSFTPTPCEPRMLGIMPLKALFSDAEYLASAPMQAAIKALADTSFSLNVPHDVRSTDPANAEDWTEELKTTATVTTNNPQAVTPPVVVPVRGTIGNELVATPPESQDLKSFLSNYSPDSIDDVTGAIEGILRARMSVEMQSAGVRAALKVFLSRMDELAAERSSSRKSGAVLSQANYQRLCDHRDAAGQMRDAANAMHDDLHDMVTTYKPANAQDKDQDQDPSGKAVDLAAVEQSRQALRVAVARASLRLVA